MQPTSLDPVSYFFNPSHVQLFLHTWFVEGEDVHPPFGISTSIYGMKLKLGSVVALDKEDDGRRHHFGQLTKV